MFLTLCRLLCGCLCLSLVLAKPQLDEDCELKATETMHDFCCNLLHETLEFSNCQANWHEKIHYTNEQDELTYMFCSSECAYNSSEFLATNRQSLNLHHVREHLENDVVNAADEQLLYETYVKCDKHALDLLSHKDVQQLARQLATHGCNPFAGLVLGCVANEMILNCPAKRFKKTPQCRVMRDYLRQCMQHLKYIL